MSTISKTSKYRCTCQYFGGRATLKGSIVEYDNTCHVCKIGARGKGNINPAMTSACPKWQERKN